MKNIQFKYKELLSKKDEVLNALNAADEGATLLSKFKEFCTICYSLKDWAGLPLSHLKSSIYIDICRGVSNGDKHVQITKDLASYNSMYYRTSVNGDFPIIQSSTGGYVGNDDSALYQEPGEDKLVVETDTGKYYLSQIIIGSVMDWKEILEYNNLL